MDFFQTREKYRRREMRHSVSFLFRADYHLARCVAGMALGSAEQKRLQADSISPYLKVTEKFKICAAW